MILWAVRESDEAAKPILSYREYEIVKVETVQFVQLREKRQWCKDGN